jgi:sRNA-binding protein
MRRFNPHQEHPMASSTRKTPVKAPPAGKKAQAAAKRPAPQSKTAPKKAPARPVVTAPVPQAAPRDDKPKKPKLVRDSFTIPKAEYAVLEALKQRAVRLGQPAKKSEVLRAGVALLAGLGDEALRGALAAVPAVKTGRPAKSA